MIEWLKYNGENIFYGFVFAILGAGVIISVVGIVKTWPR